ncbi:MAG: hypothetical protein WC770_06290 [Phycisphaerae bacterium]|jgi:hypothetical protein
MNRTQKFAVVTIIGMLLTMASLALLLIPKFFFGRCVPLPVRITCLTILFIVFSGGLYFAIKKQRKDEVDTDERDIAIQKVAATISLASILVVVGISLVVANLVWGLNAEVPLWMLMLLFGVLVFIASVVYHTAILVQYGRSKSHE